ncbi:MAG: hypothetical protein Tsb0032_23560 [Kiloniellaceae bacterium]
MAWSAKRKADLVEDLGLLIVDLCQEWGFCNQLRARDLIKENPLLTAEDFARAVLQAEGMNADSEIQWRRRIWNKFTERYGSSVSSDSYIPQERPT